MTFSLVSTVATHALARCCQVVFGFLGSIISTLKIYVFPALMLLARAQELDPANRRDDSDALLLPSHPPLAVGAAEFGARSPALLPPVDDALAPPGETSRLVPSVAPQQQRASFSGGGVSRQATLPDSSGSAMPQFLPRSPFWLRVQGCLLLALAFTIATLGTAANAAFL